jgi:hypothetical protein
LEVINPEIKFGGVGTLNSQAETDADAVGVVGAEERHGVLEKSK